MSSTHASAAPARRRFLLAACAWALGACAGAEPATTQQADDAWQPVVADPAYPAGAGPVILVDAAHGNFHTVEGRFAPFAELLRLDGYRVESAAVPATAELLGRGSVYVIANAVLGGDEATWALPTPAAFTQEEIRAIVAWVENGGSLLLIADHMPFPGSTAALADALGIVFYDGYAMRSLHEGGSLTFTRAAGTLAGHAITEGRSASEAVESVRSFTGQAFRSVEPIEPLLHMPDDWLDDEDVIGLNRAVLVFLGFADASSEN